MVVLKYEILESQFKVGDVLMCVAPYDGLEVNNAYIVQDVVFCNNGFGVVLDGIPNPKGFEGFHEDRFIKIQNMGGC